MGLDIHETNFQSLFPFHLSFKTHRGFHMVQPEDFQPVDHSMPGWLIQQDIVREKGGNIRQPGMLQVCQ